MLSRYSKLAMVAAEDGMHVETNFVYTLEPTSSELSMRR
ncbi:MAG: hypothetical protein ABIO93_17970 [Dyadobacter sp.]